MSLYFLDHHFHSGCCGVILSLSVDFVAAEFVLSLDLDMLGQILLHLSNPTLLNGKSGFVGFFLL